MTGRAGLSSGKETVVMLILEFQEHRVNEEGREIFDSYDWWKELVSRAAQGADRFELRCWEDEREGIAFGQKYGEQQESTTQELVYTGALSQEALDALLDGCVAADGALSYFTLNLYSGREDALFQLPLRLGGLLVPGQLCRDRLFDDAGKKASLHQGV